LDVARVLGANSIEMAFQPIVMLESGAVIGYEALARFPGEDVVLPWPWFAAAAEQGLEQELELAAVREALARLDDLPDGAFVSINVTPLTAVHPIVAEMLAEVDVTRVVLEIKERATEGAHAQFARLFEELRATGVRIAVDNAGVSATNLRQILDVHPDIVKIDADITRGIHLDPVKQSIAAAFSSLASRSGALSLAEGVEAEAERTTLESIGTMAGQGYLFGRPEYRRPLPSVPES
jgi:EAL domain-containing protein (putative c-di-GMP-specific phosphodiesterase class I)